MLNLLPKYLTSEKIWFDNKAERVEHHAQVTTGNIFLHTWICTRYFLRYCKQRSAQGLPKRTYTYLCHLHYYV